MTRFVGVVRRANQEYAIVFSLYLLFSSYGPPNFAEKFIECFFPKLIASLKSTYLNQSLKAIVFFLF